MPEPTHPCDLFYYFTSCYGVSLPGCSQSLHQRLSGVLISNRAVIFILPNLILTIPIDNRHCFTHRFSPTGFILNALDSTAVTQSFRLAFRLKPIRSIQSYAEFGLFHSTILVCFRRKSHFPLSLSA